MATKTVVCPECGSAAAPGRYACTECGALLAAVALTPRGGAPTAEPEPEIGIDDGDGPPAADASGDDERGPAAILAATTDVDVADDLPASGGAIVAADAPAEPNVHHPGGDLEFDENAPLAAAAHSMTAPDVLHDLADEPPMEDDASLATAPPTTAPSWPPPGDRGPIARPDQRTPAGTYLPPSAVLPPLDAGFAGGGAGGSPAPGGAGMPPVPGVATRSSDQASPASSWAGSGSAALSDALGSARVTAAASRRAIAAGAGLAALGMLLPWVNTLPGASPFAGYLDRWGLAGPGLWLVFLGLVVLTAVAVSSGRAASWPIGLPAVATAAFLVGLVWPYAVGGFGRSIGIWVIVVGAIVLGGGGLLDRHSEAEPTV
ncbi:MAG TPA: hypothetical protein VHM48_06160 [Candidatus Limnocylindrales bacterium]|nr:hypothetical protein [Candidatus Limnocylindrales bacterium]